MSRALAFAIAVLASGCDFFFPLSDPKVVPADGDGPTDTDASSDGKLPGKRVFVTAGLFTGSLGGVPGANARCQEEAEKGQLLGNFFAWISTLGSAAGAQIPPASAQPYTLVGGAKVADSTFDLKDGSIDHPIDLTQHGGQPIMTSTSCNNGTGVWSNTSALGASVSATDCSGWTSSDPSETGNAGNHAAMDATWSDDVGCHGISCNQQFALYCIER